MRWIVVTLVSGMLLSVVAPLAQATESDAALERFALAEDREAALAAFTPGSVEQRYYRGLLLQHQGRFAEAAAHAEAMRSDGVAGGDELCGRLASLVHAQDPALAWRLLRHQVPLAHADHAPAPEDPVEVVEYVSWDAVRIRALQGGGMADLTDDGVRLALPGVIGTKHLHAALERLWAPDAEQLVDAVVADLGDDPAKAFGGLSIHRRLTPAQLAAVAAARPAILASEAYGQIVLAQLAFAHAHRPWRRDDGALRAYLDDILARCGTEGLRGARELALAHRVALARRAGEPLLDAVRALHATRRPAETPAITSDAAAAVLGLEPIRSAALLETAIDELLSDLADPASLIALVGERGLRERHLVARVLAGAADPAALVDELGVVRAEDLRRRVEIGIGAEQRQRWTPAEPVTLHLRVKNTPQLLVRVFAIDLAAALRSGATLDARFDVAGLEPAAERRIPVDAPAWRRMALTVPVPEAMGPGAWLVEVSGAGRAARALVRKGDLTAIAMLDQVGHRLRLVDEAGRPVRDGEAWVGAKRFAAAADGDVRIPFSSEPGPREVLLLGAGRAALQRVTLGAAQWAMRADVIAPRQQLIAGTEATLVCLVRPELGGRLMPASSLQRPRMRVAWRMVGGSEIAGEDVALDAGDDHDALVRVRVPSGALGLAWRISAGAPAESGAPLAPLEAAGVVAINGIATEPRFLNWLLLRDGASWVVEQRGLAGEPLRSDQWTSAHPRRATNDVFIGGSADERGRVPMGELPGVHAIEAGEETGLRERWALQPPLPSARPRHASIGDEIAIPCDDQHEASAALWRSDGETWLEAVPDAVRTLPGRILVRAPAVGEYRLVLRARSGSIMIPVVIAEPAGAGVGRLEDALVELDEQAFALVARAEDDAVAVQVAGTSPTARVHVVALAGWPEERAMLAAGHSDGLADAELDEAASDFDERELDREERYVLERRSAARVAGVMLPRPSLLLNAIEAQPSPLGAYALGCAKGSRQGGGKRRSLGRFGASRGPEVVHAWSSFDWLAGPGVVLANLRPGADGSLRIPRARLGAARALLVTAVDGGRALSTMVALGAADLPLRERRLSEALPVTPALGMRTRLVALAPGEAELLPSHPLAKARIIDTAALLLDALRAANPDVGLERFAPLTRWHELDAGERRRFYHAHACHETHLFLARHDPEWFARELAPYLAQKAQPGFIDAWLLGRDLAPWAVVPPATELDAVERLLLARRLPEAAAEAERRAVADMAYDDSDDIEARDRFVTAVLATATSGVPPATVADAGPLEPVQLELGPRSDDDGFARWPGAPRLLVEPGWHGRGDLRGPLGRDARFWSSAARAGEPWIPADGIERLYRCDELLAALALADLPLRAGAHRRERVADGERLVAATPLLLALRAPVELPAGGEGLALHTRVVALPAAATATGIQGALAPLMPYAYRVTLVNADAGPAEVELLAQLPVGAVPLLGGSTTRSAQLVVPAFGSVALEMAFYLPEPGEREQAPVRVTDRVHLRASSAARTWRVSVEDGARPRHWSEGDDAAVLAALAAEPLRPWDLPEAATIRARDAGFYARAIATLRERRAFAPDLWRYAFAHQDALRAAELLRASDGYRDACGGYAEGLAAFDDLADGRLPVIEIAPLVNARAHAVDGERSLGSGEVRHRWRALLRYLAHRPRLDDRSLLALAFQLTLQDRGPEAAAAFARVDAGAVATRLQYDYGAAWLALMRGDREAARTFALPHREHPVQRWRDRFGAVLAQLEPEAADAAAAPASGRPSLALDVDGDALVVRAEGIAACELRLRAIDLEALFSRSPFSPDLGTARALRLAPSAVMPVTVDAGAHVARIELPAEWSGRDTVIEAVGGGERAVLVRPSRGLALSAREDRGELLVLDRDGRPIAAAYVKVFRDEGHERVLFHKDGYTDHRGMFDYAALTSAAPQMERFALYVDADDRGSATRIVAAPPR